MACVGLFIYPERCYVVVEPAPRSVEPDERVVVALPAEKVAEEFSRVSEELLGQPVPEASVVRGRCLLSRFRGHAYMECTDRALCRRFYEELVGRLMGPEKRLKWW